MNRDTDRAPFPAAIFDVAYRDRARADVGVPCAAGRGVVLDKKEEGIFRYKKKWGGKRINYWILRRGINEK